MKKHLAILLPLIAGPVLAEPPFESPPGSYQRIYQGKDILSIEETAASFFDDLRDDLAKHLSEEDPWHPKNYLRDRLGLSEDEIKEILALAPRQLTPLTNEGAPGCAALNAAKGPDEMLRVLEEGERQTIRLRKQEGLILLFELTPKTRASLRKALHEERKNITVGVQDWKKLRDTAPEGLEAFRAASCTGK